MKHVIVGTAGHVDHGKSTLIRALTGIDPDRLKEEKQRGLTIDIGFAWFDLPSGRRAGIVDVPGHEKFIKNMLAGAVGFDVVLLVIAADEGIMPQTKEHLNILSLLNVNKGIVVLTKTDMVDEEWLELVYDDIKEQLKTTFLCDADIIPVSALKGDGLDDLIKNIDRLTEETESKDVSLDFRMPIDRSFSIKGFGTVVTGTLMEGSISIGDIAEVQPISKQTRIRNIQIHGKKVEHAFAGQRVALNLADVTVDDCKRGQVLAAPKLLSPTMMLDTMLSLLKDANRPLKHWDRIRLYTGTSEVLGRVVLFGRDEMFPGEELPIQLRLEEPLVALRDDRFVIRLYSPLETVGGGHIIDAHPTKKRRFKSGIIEELQLRATGTPQDILLQSMLKADSVILEQQKALKDSGLRDAEQALEELIKDEQIITISIDSSAYLIISERFEQLRNNIIDFLKQYHSQWPLREGALRAEIRSRFLQDISPRLYQQFILLLADSGEVCDTGEYVKLCNHQVEFSGKYEKWYRAIQGVLQQDPFSPPGIKQIAEDINATVAQVKEVLNAMVNLKEVTKIAEDFYLLISNYQQVKEMLISYLKSNGSIDLATFRNLLKTSRKYALPLLELFDQQKITRRQGNERVLIIR